jgi:PAS domain S-box-containing protein
MNRIMLVDDEAIITMQLEKRLASMGYEVVGVASSGVQSLHLARELKPDLVLMDIVMPGDVDGIEAASRIRSELDIPIVFLTAFADETYLERAKGADPFGYLVKPFHEKEVHASIEVALHRGMIEKRFRDREQLYRLIMENAFDPICVVDREGRVLDANRRAEQALGFIRSDLCGKPFQDMLARGEWVKFHRSMREVLGTGNGTLRHLTLRSSSGRKLRFELSMSMVSHAGYTNALLFILGDSASRRMRSFKKGMEDETPPRARAGGGGAAVLAEEASPGTRTGFPVSEGGSSPRRAAQVCTSCGRRKNEKGVWIDAEVSASDHLGLQYSFGICSECAHVLWPEMPQDMEREKKS